MYTFTYYINVGYDILIIYNHYATTNKIGYYNGSD